MSSRRKVFSVEFLRSQQKPWKGLQLMRYAVLSLTLVRISPHNQVCLKSIPALILCCVQDIEGKLSVRGDELSETAKVPSLWSQSLGLRLVWWLMISGICIWYSHNMLQEKTGGISGMFKRSPKPAPRSLVATVINIHNFTLFLPLHLVTWHLKQKGSLTFVGWNPIHPQTCHLKKQQHYSTYFEVLCDVNLITQTHTFCFTGPAPRHKWTWREWRWKSDFKGEPYLQMALLAPCTGLDRVRHKQMSLSHRVTIHY